MATQKRDVELGIGINVKNQERVAALTADMEALAKSGAEATPEFKKLADELEDLGKKAAALDKLQSVEGALQQTGDAMQQAREKADRLKEALSEQRTVTASFAEAQKQAKEKLDQTRLALINAEEQLDLLRGSTNRAGKSADDFQQKQRTLVETVTRLTAEASRQELVVRKANGALKEAKDALSKAETSSNRAERAVNALNSQFEKQTAVVNKAKDALQQTGDVADNSQASQEALSKSLDDLAKAQVQLNAETTKRLELERAVGAANDRNVKLAEQAQQKRLAAAKAAQSAAIDQAAAEAKVAYALDEIAAREAEVAANAKRAGEALSQAFSQTGTRSIAAIKADIDEVNRSLQLLQTQNLSKFELERAFAGANVRIQELKRELATVPGTFDLVGAGVDLVKNQFLQLAAAYQGIDLARKFIDAQVQIEGLRRALTISTGSIQEAERQIRFLRETADLTGQSFGEIADEYKKFSVALTTSGYSAQQTEELFLAVSSAAGKLGLSSDRTASILNALSQIANKGVVSMEELRGQLGESLPGALQIAANAVGIPTERLIKLIETGNVLSRDLLPYLPEAFAKAFGSSQTKVEGFLAAWNRLKNAITETAQEAADGAFFKGLTTAVDFAAENFKLLSTAVIDTGKAFAAVKIIEYLSRVNDVSAATRLLTTSQVANTEAVVANSVAKTRNAVVEAEVTLAHRSATGAIVAESQALVANTAASTANTASKAAGVASLAGALPTLQATGAAASSLGSTLLSGAARFTGYALAAKFAWDILEDLGTAIGEGAAKLMGYGKIMEDAQAKMQQADDDLKRRLTTQQPLVLQLQDAYLELNKRNEEAVSLAEKQAKAIEVEGNALTALSQQFDDVTRKKQTDLEVASASLQASQEVYDARAREAATLGDYATKLQAAADANKDLSDKTKELIATTQQKAAVAAEEASRAAADLELQKTRVQGLEAESRALRDNSGSVDVLRTAYENAAMRAEIMNELRKEGVVSSEAAARATRDEAEALTVYKDALRDAAANLQLRIDRMRVDAQLTQTNLSLKAAEAKAAEQVANAIGDERAATEAQISQKRVAIDQTRLAAEEKRKEAEASIENLKALREEITGTDDISARKREEIDIRIKAEQIKMKEAEASKSVVKEIEAEIEALRKKFTVATQISKAGTPSALTASSDIKLDENGRTQYQRDLLSKQSGPVDNSYIFQLRERQARGDSFAASELPAIENAYRTAQQNLIAMQNSSVTSLDGLRDAQNWVATLRNIYETASSGASLPPLTNNGPASASIYRVDVKLGGQTTQVNTASQADAQQLVGLLKTLQSASNRAS